MRSRAQREWAERGGPGCVAAYESRFFFPLFLFLDFSKPKEGRPYGRFMRLAVEDNLYDIQYEYVIDLIEKNDWLKV